MPYNTRRKSLSLLSLGIHIPVTHAARAASKSAARHASSSASVPSASPPADARSHSPESHPSKRYKRSHAADTAVEQTPPPSPPPAAGLDASSQRPKIVLEGINDDIVEASILQLQSTANRPHLIKELATVLSQKLSSVQQSANPCAIISSRLASYMKRPCWSALAPCPLAKELETVHPRRTYFFLTTYPRQPLPDPSVTRAVHPAMITPSVSLTDDSGSDDVEARRRELSPSPEVDLSSPEFDDGDDDFADFAMPMTPIGSFKPRYLRQSRDMRHDSPPLEKDEREFTQTADVLQKRKLSDELPIPDTMDRNSAMEYGFRDDIWFGETRTATAATFITSPAMKPSVMSTLRKEDDADAWLKINKMFEWDQSAESIEIDELDCLLEGC
ncbi:mucin [Hirsutella rhossiliensis]|uniref:Mucin n=1 Tax=Hirsutella rhossiliensis TaxID=111463 RepID=A0A9P8MUY8_9HYPO|nr:mucin [Hirsutella rhossiliensis]KAH0961614.1 mucin [Hirsutella rhossiliensis]